MIITRVPFRISFFGGGTDLPEYYKNFGGAVLSTTIDKYLYITCRHMPPYWEYKHQLIYGSKNERVNEIDEIDHPSIRETMKYFGINYGLDLHYNTDIPARSGIGSSSSFTVGLIHALYGLGGRIVSKRQLAADAIHIEQDLIKEAVGSQDQIAAAFGGLNHIKFKQDMSFEVQPMTISENRLREFNDHLVLIFTGFQRFASDIEKDKIQKISSNFDSLHHMAKSTEQAVEILGSDTDICEFGGLMNDNWQLKKSLSDKVSNQAIDDIYQLGINNGAIGGKLLGAGGGGFMLFFVKPENREKLRTSLKDYLYVPFQFDKTGSQVIYYRGEE